VSIVSSVYLRRCLFVTDHCYCLSFPCDAVCSWHSSCSVFSDENFGVYLLCDVVFVIPTVTVCKLCRLPCVPQSWSVRLPCVPQSCSVVVNSWNMIVVSWSFYNFAHMTNRDVTNRDVTNRDVTNRDVKPVIHDASNRRQLATTFNKQRTGCH